MSFRRRLWLRILRCSPEIFLRRRRWFIWLTFAFIGFSFLCLLLAKDRGYSDCDTNEIDVVYTWVNGSDAAFIAAVKRYNPYYDPSRFDDKNELRYSLRSLERYAKWIRHIYIITNGQIPNWLDLSNERVTVVPHEVLAPNLSYLPTFSSASIETFLHRIPKLSKRFLYLNDDVFLGAPLYPEDLYSASEGVRIYQAWMVPDCATDCPWTYIGDSACDQHCNIAECQYDGGDCADIVAAHGISYNTDDVEAKTPPQPTVVVDAVTPVHMFPKRRLVKKKMRRNATSFKELMRRRNVSTLEQLRQVVENYNNHKLQPLYKVRGISTIYNRTTTPRVEQMFPRETYKDSTDIYSHSLINTNMLLNRIYGFKPRHVIAHVGFLLDRDIINALQTKFRAEVEATAAHRFRAPTDLQFAFAYYSFIMNEMQNLNVEEIFDEYDTDLSGTWSDREIRTLLTRIYPPPLDWSAMHFFEQVVANCTNDLNMHKEEQKIIYSTLVYERYEDSNLPTITRNLVAKCPQLAEALVSNFAVRPKYKFNINSKRNAHNNFIMLTSNVSMVVDALDKLRRNPRKFNCINDNLDGVQSEDNELIRHLLEDFYLSFFPQRSKFELEPQYRNRFANWYDYQRWKRRKRAALVIGYGFTILLCVFLIRFLCVHKAKFVRRCIQNL